MSDSYPLPLVLGSSSPYRKQLLEKLGLSFTAVSPDIDETHSPGETPKQLVARLAAAKARKVAKEHKQHIIIGSDQIAVLENEQILGKPGSVEKAIEQLTACNGQVVTFFTGLSVLNSENGKIETLVEPFEVGFRQLTAAEIKSYVEKEQPLNCAGSFKSEGLGISLFAFMHGDDPNSLIGLPLIRLLELLRHQGISPL
ncbi:septum formation inhibitor Maf [Aliidiomarina minuta]|uniref:7-methyl-GTP pyrophosphatase n=1 Tax=Aliidiomarina minuta TaxID=880057 RepID=A0A432W6C9_9GAMM|nr:Maf family nucleotide pyrophosphatase [Aliidiomarina minuta]RUO25634.1 septum formation inhibitor Maf [Aliidiomarina minuta]